MSSWAAIAILSLALGLGGIGCGTRSSPASSPTFPVASSTWPTLTWAGDGNPLVPFCSTTSAPTNCVSSYTIQNVTTGAMATVAITTTSYGPIDPADSYEIRVNGYDGGGNPISSPFVALPTSQ